MILRSARRDFAVPARNSSRCLPWPPVVTSTRRRRPTIRLIDPNLRARADRESPYSPATRLHAKRVVARCRTRRSRAAALPHRTPILSTRNRFVGRLSTATRLVRRAAAVVLAVAARSTTGLRSSCVMMVQRRDRRGPHRFGSLIKAARVGRRGDGGSCFSLSARLAPSSACRRAAHDHTAALTGCFASRQPSSLARPVRAAAVFGSPMTQPCVLPTAVGFLWLRRNRGQPFARRTP